MFGLDPFHCFSDFHYWRWPISITSMRPDDGNTTFYSVYILRPFRLARPGSRELSFRCGVLGDLRDDVQKGVHFNGIFHGVFLGSFPWFCNLAPLGNGLLSPVLCAMLTFVGGSTRSKLASTPRHCNTHLFLTLSSHPKLPKHLCSRLSPELYQILQPSSP